MQRLATQPDTAPGIQRKPLLTVVEPDGKPRLPAHGTALIAFGLVLVVMIGGLEGWAL